MNRHRRTAAGAAALTTVFVVAACSGSSTAIDPAATSAPPSSAVTPATSASPSAVPGPGSLTPITLSSIGEPLVVPGSDGNQHIDYDLLVTNVFTAPVTLTSVDVRSQGGASVLTIEGDALPPVVQGNFVQQPVDPPAVVPVSGQVSVSIDVLLPAGAELPTSLEHVISWSVPADAPALAALGETSGSLTALPLAVSPIEPTVLAPPLRGDNWMVLQGCCVPNGHRSLRFAVAADNDEVKAEMFAIEWVQLQPNGLYFNGDGATNADFPYIGTDLLAVADGTVVHTRDGVPNETPFEPPQYVKEPKDYLGNTVVIQIGPGRYATYGHLEAGTVAVEPGDQVKAGDVVGKLGNSGNSTAAHLHFVVTDEPDFLTATSLPIVFDEWTLRGTGQIPDEPSPIAVTGPSGPQTETLPLQHSVGDFG